MNDFTPHIPLFDHLKDGVVVDKTPDGLAFWWSRKGVGFGSITLGVINGQFTVDTECMSPEFCAEIIKQAITEALARQRSEESTTP